MEPKTGDLLFVNKNTTWGDIVGYFQGNPYHHIGVIIVVYNKTYVFEAIATGMAFTPYEEYLHKAETKGYSLLVKRHKGDPFKRIREKEIMNFCLPLTDRPYEFINLVCFQAIRFGWLKLTGRNLWIGRSKAKSKRSLICSELVALFYNHFIGMFEDNWHMIAPSGIINDPVLKTITKIN